MLNKILITIILWLLTANVMGHPMPHSILSFDVKSDRIYATLKVPMPELQLAVPFDVSQQTETLLQEHQTQLTNYFLAHIRAQSMDGHEWQIKILDVKLAEAQQTATGKYQELTLAVLMQPPSNQYVRHFNLFYDAIIHQVVTHKIFVTLRHDWPSGKTDDTEKSLGVVELNIADNNIPPLLVNLDEGSNWAGFWAMVRLGIHHILGGVDHLLFLLALLLPTTLIAENGRWTTFAGIKTSILNVLKIVTAFTIGHSLSLFLATLQWVSLPVQPVEITIAITVFVTAIHALRPIFAKREIYIALAFGLIHGLAFSEVLTELNLDGKEMMLSLLGFNLGIEFIQVFVIFITIPWIIILSKNHHYTYFRMAGALLAIIASMAWITERIMLKANEISTAVELVFNQGKWLVLLLMCAAMYSQITTRRTAN